MGNFWRNLLNSCLLLSYPVKGEWGDWQNWGDCSGSCGENHFKSRTRSCTETNGGCPRGDTTQIVLCNEIGCPVDGRWGDWGRWGDCDFETSTRRRIRRCDYPLPSFGGSNCQGLSEESDSCEMLPFIYKTRDLRDTVVYHQTWNTHVHETPPQVAMTDECEVLHSNYWIAGNGCQTNANCLGFKLDLGRMFHVKRIKVKNARNHNLANTGNSGLKEFEMRMSEHDEGPYFQIAGELSDVRSIACAHHPVNGTNYPLHSFPVNRAFRFLRFYVISVIPGRVAAAVQYFGLE